MNSIYEAIRCATAEELFQVASEIQLNATVEFLSEHPDRKAGEPLSEGEVAEFLLSLANQNFRENKNKIVGVD